MRAIGAIRPPRMGQDFTVGAKQRDTGRGLIAHGTVPECREIGDRHADMDGAVEMAVRDRTATADGEIFASGVDADIAVSDKGAEVRGLLRAPELAVGNIEAFAGQRVAVDDRLHPLAAFAVGQRQTGDLRIVGDHRRERGGQIVAVGADAGPILVFDPPIGLMDQQVGGFQNLQRMFPQNVRRGLGVGHFAIELPVVIQPCGAEEHQHGDDQCGDKGKPKPCDRGQHQAGGR